MIQGSLRATRGLHITASAGGPQRTRARFCAGGRTNGLLTPVEGYYLQTKALHADRRQRPRGAGAIRQPRWHRVAAEVGPTDLTQVLSGER
jgi:hypothetical protein